jgi:hypothetical protein
MARHSGDCSGVQSNPNLCRMLRGRLPHEHCVNRSGARGIASLTFGEGKPQNMLTALFYLWLAAIGVFAGYLIRRLPSSSKVAIASLAVPLLGYYWSQAFC